MEDERKKTPYHKMEGLLQTPELYQYIMDTTVYPREPQPLKELRAATANHPGAFIATAPDAGQLISLLLKQSNAKKTIEIGVFTGYSLLLTALTIPQDGKVIGIDRDLSAYEIGLPIIEKSGVAHKINFIHSEALPALDKILESDEDVESFDFAFVDADKTINEKYHERLLKLVKPGGIIIYDNTLLAGTVAMPEELVIDPKTKHYRNYVLEFNKFLAADTRVDISLLPLGDGITVCRRI